MRTLRLSLATAICAIAAIVHPCWAVPGDLDRDGDVDFDDFFMFADNFGKTGSPETETVYDTVTVEVQQVVTRYDTLTIEHVTVYDTVIYGREEIRYEPPPPLGEIAQSLELRSQLITRLYSNSLLVEIHNPTATTLYNLTFRLTVRDQAGLVLHTETYSYDIGELISQDTRATRLYLYDESSEVIESIRSGNYTLEVAWQATGNEVNNVSLALRSGSLQYATPFAISGEVENTTDLTVDNYTIYFFGRDANGNPAYLAECRESSFGILPGGTSPFSIDPVMVDYSEYLMREDISQLYYAIRWQWTGAAWGEYEVSPATRLF